MKYASFPYGKFPQCRQHGTHIAFGLVRHVVLPIMGVNLIMFYGNPLYLEEMREMIQDSGTEGIKVTAEKSKHENSTDLVCERPEQQFYQEMKEAVKKHYRYLYGVKQMPPVKLSGYYLAPKRLVDILLGLSGLILLSPLFLIVSIIIKIDSPGPIIYSQQRVGKKRKLFRMYKFRTMVQDAESKTGPVWAAKDDPRLTRVGKFLRNSKIDELPQLANLLAGNMTLVGPRPERPFFVNQFAEIIPGYSRRLEVTPGITGLAQLRNGYDSGVADVIRKLRFDNAYIKKMCLILDFKLLMETFILTITGKL